MKLNLAAIDVHAAQLSATPIVRSHGPWTREQVSLEAWVTAAQARQLPVIPIDLVGRVPIDGLFNVLDGDPPTPAITALFEAVQARRTPQTMLRWDCCASTEIKTHLGSGHPEWHEAFLRPLLDDSRLVDLAFEYPGESLALWQRPWIPAWIVDQYPVEFRVFVQQHQIVGISSYYPQRPLPDTLEMRRLLTLIHSLSTRLLDAVDDCTHDWLITTDHQPVLLEGGPPHTPVNGAHPCCFAPGQIHGVALAPQPGALC